MNVLGMTMSSHASKRLAGLAGMVDVDNVAVDLRNCALYSGKFSCFTPGSDFDDPPKVSVINNLFERAEVDFDDSHAGCSLDFYNNTGIKGGFDFSHPSTVSPSIWRIYDNLFDHCALTGSGAYVSSACNLQREGSNSGGISTTELPMDVAYASGPYGARYIDASYDYFSWFANAGSRSAALAGLSAYTIRTDDTQDTDTVDIGFHYPVEDLSGGTFWTDSGVSADAMARAIMAGTGATVVPGSASFTGATMARGFFGRGISVGLPSSFETGVILSSGNIHNAAGPNDDIGWIKETTYGLAGDADLDAVLDALEPNIPGYPEETLDTEDAAVLQFVVIPTTGFLQFDYIFASEEYPEWVVDVKNDAIAIFVSGVNVAWVPNTSDVPVCVYTINQSSNSDYYRENPFSPNEVLQLQYDGFTSTAMHPWLSASTPVVVGEPVTVKIVIADEDDDSRDSAVLISASLAQCY